MTGPWTRRRLLRAVGTGTAAALAGCSLPGEDAGNGAFAFGEHDERAPADRWPAVRGTRTNSGASAGSVPDGPVAWTAEVPGRVLTGVALTPDAVYVPSEGGVLTAFDRADGSERWTVEVDGPLSAPLVADGRVYAATHTSLHAVGTDGERRWMAPLSRGAEEPSFREPTPAPAPPMLGDGTLYVGGAGPDLFAVDRDGERRWARRVVPPDADGGVPTRGTVTGPPAVRDGTLHVGTRTGEVRGVSTADGRTEWRLPVGDRVTGAVAVPTDVGVVRAGRALVGVDPASGERRWRRALPQRLEGGSPQSTTATDPSPAVVGSVERGGAVFGRAGDWLVALDADGRPGWAQDLRHVVGEGVEGPERGVGGGGYQSPAPSRCSPTVVGATPERVDGSAVVVGAMDGVRAFGTEFGQLRWFVPTAAPVRADLAAVDGLVVAADVEGGVYAVA